MYKTDKPFGFLNKDLIWLQQNIKKDIIPITSREEYDSVQHKKKRLFVVIGLNVFTGLYLSSHNGKLKGRFIILDNENSLMKAKAIILDRDNMNIDCNAFIRSSLPYVSLRKKSIKTSFESESKKFISTISSRVLNQSKVFKKTYQNIELELLALAKKKMSVQKFNRYKSYLPELLCKVCVNFLPYEEILNIKLGNEELKNKDGYNDVVKFCSTPSTIRTIQAYQDVVLNGTEFNRAVFDNYADAFTLKKMLDAWKPSPVSFRANYSRKLHNKLKCVSKDSLISKELVKSRNKKDVFKYSGKFNFKIHKGIIKLDTLIQKLKLPEDEYRVLGSEVKDEKVTIDKQPFAIHGIHTNAVFSVGC